MTRRHPRKAFTLVELLVVIAILALLVSMLTPFLTRAREVARRAMCLSNQRTLGGAGMGFAASHQGRGPGGGLLTNPGNPGWTSSVTWPDILNAEYFRAYTVQRMGYAPTKGKLYCPNMRYWGSLYPRGHQWNMDALGGADWDSNFPPNYSQYGKPVEVMYVNYMYGPPYLHAWYRLGAELEKFRRPAYQILIREAEYGNDSCASIWGVGDTVTLNVGEPRWADSSLQYGFRHLLPTDPVLYQQQATACYAFIDGHVEITKPTMTVNAPDRYAMKP